jgi:hypothetical protein
MYFYTSVFGDEIQNWIRPILAFSIQVGASKPMVFWSRIRSSTNSVSSIVPLKFLQNYIF